MRYVDQMIRWHDPESDEDFPLIRLSKEAHCDCGLLPWCTHLERVISDGLDGDIARVVRKDTEDFPNGEIAVRVPIIPTENLWVDVKLFIIKNELVAAYLKTPEYSNDQQAASGSDLDQIFLGVIGPGEGRGVIRNLIWAWWKVRMQEVQIPECASSSHGFMAVKAAKQREDERYKFADDWMLYWSAMCLYCSTNIANFDDLIPDVSAPAGRRAW